LKASKIEENQRLFQNSSNDVYGIESNTQNKYSSKTPNISGHEKKGSVFHLNCRDGSSMIEKQSNYGNMPSIIHKKHSSLFNYLSEKDKSTIYEPLMKAVQRT
jgi:hypothetical protein